ncbi:MAG: fibronectin type III domain-containing protein, partial [Bacteroidota bacterium]
MTARNRIDNSKSPLDRLWLGVGHKLWISFLLLMGIFAQGQQGNFPVQVTPQVVPPAPLYFTDYANLNSVNSPLRVQLLLNDLTIANREVGLRLSFQGNGLSFQSNAVVSGAAPIFLEGGVPVLLSNVELEPYLRFENISGIGPDAYGRAIPEGSYQFCFEVFDGLTGNRLSSRSCTTVFIFQNEPPFLVLPTNYASLPETNPPNIVFQWTPRHTNVSNVEYQFSLVEIWDPYVDPQQAFLSSPPIFETTTTATTYIYGPSDPLLLSDKRYAWRVQARAIQGAETIGLFKNQGYSEIYTFSYAHSCNPPTGIYHEVKGSTNTNIFWDDFSTDIPEYTVRYRQKNISGAEWFFSKTAGNLLTLWDLKAGTTYEYQVMKKCSITEGDWSFGKQFTTFIADEETSLYECGINPDFSLDNRDPLPNLAAGERFTAGDFPVNILEVNGGNGRFTGKGYVTIPYLNSIRLGVKFTNVLLNTDRQLLEGSVVTMYDSSLSNILDIDETIDTIEAVTDALGEPFEGSNDLDEIRVNFPLDPDKDIKIVDGNIVITNPENGATVLEPLGDDKVVVDGTGQVYHIDAEGNVTEGGQIDSGGLVNADNVSGVSNNGQLERLTAEAVLVTFNTSGTYGFDQMPPNPTEKLKKEYKVIQNGSGEEYILPHHVVPNGGETQITATIEIKNDTYTADEVIFKTKQGELIPATFSGSTATLTLKGHYTYENETIYAVVPAKEDRDKQLTAGAFTLWHLTNREINVALVSVNGASLGDVETAVANIFQKGAAIVNFKGTIPLTIDVDAVLGSNGMDVGDSPWANAYNNEQKSLRDLAMAAGANSSSTYYIIVCGEDIENTKSIAGFMPLQRQFGFVFEKYVGNGEEAKGTTAKTLAHELGHGVFALQHPFEQYSTAEDATNWLMDYGTETTFPHMHWAQIHDPALKFYLFQKEEEGEIANKTWFTPDWRPFQVKNTTAIISKDIGARYNGAIPGFQNTLKISYHAEIENGTFTGNYVDSYGNPSNSISYKTPEEGDDVYFFEYNEGCGTNKRLKYAYNSSLKSFADYIQSGKLLERYTYPCNEKCTRGDEFIVSYSSIEDELIQKEIGEIAKMICASDADPSFIDELIKKGISNLYGWQQIDYYEGYGDRSLEAFQDFKRIFDQYIFYFNASKIFIKTADADDRKAILQIAYNLSSKQLELIEVADKLTMLQIVASGFMGGYWTSSHYNVEAIALKLINSITDDQSETFIKGLTSSDYNLSNGQRLYEGLYSKMHDFFGDANFTAVANKLIELTLKSKNLKNDAISNEEIDEFAMAHVIWDV